ncbi:hypothetical protein, partial [Candidatus Entotheonella palauensis]|uniref:hypothetical protein n=1 Tax=Candidatus Entotheonella palauensis TaxID=93172 RepID=UPI001177FB4A
MPSASEPNRIDVVTTAQAAPDCFFVWMAMPPQQFWVNLNPTEPNRIVATEMGKTHCGWIMLEADFRMKTTVSELTNPQTELGRDYSDQLFSYARQRRQKSICSSYRHWIVPGVVKGSYTEDYLFIEQADLDVKLESEYLALQGFRASSGCPPSIDPDVERFSEALYRRTILQALIQRVNTAPEYAELRSIFRTLILAAWYKRMRPQGMAFSHVMGSGDVREWYHHTSWDPRHVFNEYVESLRNPVIHILKGAFPSFRSGFEQSQVRS